MSIRLERFACLLVALPMLAFAQQESPPSSDAASQPPANPPANPEAQPPQAPEQEQTQAPKPPPGISSTTPCPVPPKPPPPPPPPKWNGDLSLGYVDSRGNSDASTLNLKFDLDYKSGPWENALNGSAFRNTADGVTTDEKYSIGDKQLYNFDPDEYVFVQIGFDDDHFGPIAERYSGSAGYGRHLLHTPAQSLDVDLGLGADRMREQGNGYFQSDLIGTFDVNYVWKISANSQFKQTLRTEFGAGNTFVDPASELKLTIVKNFFAALGYEIQYNSTTPANTHHTDEITTINVGYAFGKPTTTAP